MPRRVRHSLRSLRLWPLGVASQRDLAKPLRHEVLQASLVSELRSHELRDRNRPNEGPCDDPKADPEA